MARWPAPSSIITSGVRLRSASCAARVRLDAAAVPIDPPATVKSSAPTITGRPSIVPDPATKASAGMAGSPVSGPNSTKDSGSSRPETRLRASRRPVARYPREFVGAAHRPGRRPPLGQLLEQRRPVGAVSRIHPRPSSTPSEPVTSTTGEVNVRRNAGACNRRPHSPETADDQPPRGYAGRRRASARGGTHCGSGSRTASASAWCRRPVSGSTSTACDGSSWTATTKCCSGAGPAPARDDRGNPASVADTRRADDGTHRPRSAPRARVHRPHRRESTPADTLEWWPIRSGRP